MKFSVRTGVRVRVGVRTGEVILGKKIRLVIARLLFFRDGRVYQAYYLTSANQVIPD